jgi:hypothetical protein
MLVMADPIIEPQLDTIQFSLSAKQWVSTETALLTVSLQATLTDTDLVKTRADIMAKLSKISPASWHVTQFDRSQDASGLEKLYVEAQARVPQLSLTHVYQNAKSVSKPGATYQINAIAFEPSIEEIQDVRAKLRQRLYQDAANELTRINAIYPKQQYTLNTVSFVDDAPQATGQQPRMVMMAAAAPAVPVSHELLITAVVQAASNRKQDMTHVTP